MAAVRSARVKLAHSERGMALTIAARPRDELIRSWDLAYALEIRPALDAARLAQAFQHIIHLHPRLRAVYRVAGGEVEARLLPPQRFSLRTVDAAAMPAAAFAAFLREQAGQAWDIERGPLIDLAAITRPRNRMVLLLRLHHLVMDAWSVEIMLRDMMTYYVGMAGGVRKPPDFDAFIAWEESFIASPAGRAQRDFWRKRLAGLGRRLALPYDRPPSSPLIARSGTEHFAIDEALAKKLRAVAQARGTTVFAVLLAAFQTLLSGVGGENDIVVTTTTARRTRAEFADTVGLVANLVALRANVADDVAFGRQVALAGRTISEALANQELHVKIVAEDLAAGRLDQAGNVGVGDTAFDQVGLCMLTPNIGEVPQAGLRLKYNPGTTTRLGPYELKMLDLDRSECTRDLTLYFNELEGRIACFFAYSADVFERGTIAGLARRLLAILEAGCNQPELALRTLKAAR
ncbi:MAG: condensation domain-containing protein [Reyranellaceae bacterium]